MIILICKVEKNITSNLSHEKKGRYCNLANKTKSEYDMQYAKQNLKRIPLNVKKEKYEEIQTAATAAGESVNGYIKKAIDARLSGTYPE